MAWHRDMLPLCGVQGKSSLFSHSFLIWKCNMLVCMCVCMQKSLIDQPFLPKYGKVFCSKDHARHYKTKFKKH